MGRQRHGFAQTNSTKLHELRSAYFRLQKTSDPKIAGSERLLLRYN